MKKRKFNVNPTIFDEDGKYIDWKAEFRKKESYLENYYEEESPDIFVRELLPAEYLDTYRDIVDIGQGCVLGVPDHSGRGVGIVKRTMSVDEEDKPYVQTFMVYDDYYHVNCCFDNRFGLINLCTYFGRGKKKIPSLCMGLAIDLDYVRLKELENLFQMIENDLVPMPTYIVNSGAGVHLYYLFEQPISLRDTVVQSYLAQLKRNLIEISWTYQTSLDTERQYQGIYQDMRIPGCWTKFGYKNKHRCSYIVRAYKTGERVDLTYLSSFCDSVDTIEDYASLSTHRRITLEEAREKYPDWYRRIVEEGQEKGFYIQSKGLYEWWKNIITKANPENEDQQIRTSREGNRFCCVCILFIMAYKCGIPLEEVTQDALNLIPLMNEREHHENNEFTEYDVMCASTYYDRKYVKWGNKTISRFCSIVLPEPKSRRNHRTQEEHLKRTRHLRMLSSYENVGRPKGSTYETVIKEWRKRNPNGKKVECIKETGLSKPTVLKWWSA